MKDIFNNLFLTEYEELERKFILSSDKLLSFLETKKDRSFENLKLSLEEYYNYKARGRFR